MIDGRATEPAPEPDETGEELAERRSSQAGLATFRPAAGIINTSNESENKA